MRLMDAPSMILAPGPFSPAAFVSSSHPSRWILGAVAVWAVYLALIGWALRRRSRLWNSIYALWNRCCKVLVIRWESRPSRVNRGLLTTAYYLERMASGVPPPSSPRPPVGREGP